MNRLGSWRLGWAMLGSAVLMMTAVACSAEEAPLVIEVEPSRVSTEALHPLLGANVVYLGEQHDRAADHVTQLAIIQGLYREEPNLAIALEMFQRPFQPVIDRYLAGDISESELRAQTEYDQRWGFPWQYYAPILRFAKDNQLPVLALNAPSEVVSQVADAGLDSLTPEDFRYLPPRRDIDTGNSDYQAIVRDSFAGHGSHGDFNFDNFFAAQVTWDETMAETIANFWRDSPDTTVVVLAGSTHIIYGYGIPDRVARRLGDSLQQTTVLLNFPQPKPSNAADAIADVLWYSD
ncbi:hypothetical protein XM38_015120 [Halomicronema hongdechloris C2206]|uniref:Haem-binding uptake Tiki superfamily ChaN domain-containing protein n=2 Tax=Halomicronema hongdechloris TaxID=1209493 RepID=A0A1Z3HJS9_9CYAN|nr:hypothetical protein XM38_015120 [Halomicronema hongdechloris C2206]